MLLGLVLAALSVRASQLPLSSPSYSSHVPDQYYELPREIKRVAVIGAGPNGLLQAATLLDHGFQVRLFEKAPKPGGVWLYTDKTPIPAPFKHVFS